MEELELLQKELNKKGFLIRRASDITPPEKISTGIFGLDYVLDGGISQQDGGHRIEFVGSESSGKTTLSLLIIKKFQELKKKCLFIDTERSLDLEWAKVLGVNSSELLVATPSTLENCGDLLMSMIPEVDLIIIDSIVAMIPEAEAERNTSEIQISVNARVNSLITRKIYHAINGKRTAIIFINQVREKIGQLYGNPETSAGGHALKHMYNTRIHFRSGDKIEYGEGKDKERIGNEIHFLCLKNKLGKPYRKTSVDFYYTGIIDNNKSLLYAGIKYGIIQQNHSMYEYENIKERGEDKFLQTLTKEHYIKIEKELLKII